MVQVGGLHARGRLALHVDLFHPALVKKIVNVSAAQRGGQGGVDVAGAQAQGARLAIINVDLELRRVVQAVAAHALQTRVFLRQFDKLLARRHQRVMPQPREVLELQIEPGTLPQPAHGRRLHDKHVGITNARQRLGRPLRDRRGILACARALAPVLEPDKGPGRVLTVAAHAQARDADQRFDFRLLEHIALELLEHRLGTVIRCAHGQLHLGHQDALVFIRQK